MGLVRHVARWFIDLNCMITFKQLEAKGQKRSYEGHQRQDQCRTSVLRDLAFDLAFKVPGA